VIELKGVTKAYGKANDRESRDREGLDTSGGAVASLERKRIRPDFEYMGTQEWVGDITHSGARLRRQC